MITKDERDLAIDQVNYQFIDTLKVWVDAEKNNLDAFITNPTQHINWNRYMVIDEPAIRSRMDLLAQVSDYLQNISYYKQGLNDVMRSQHDYGLDRIPSTFFGRLLDWLVIEDSRMHELEDQCEQNIVPAKELEGFVTYDSAALYADCDNYDASTIGLQTVYQYAREQEGLV